MYFFLSFLCAYFFYCFTDYELYEVWKRNLENKLINVIVCEANNTIYCSMDLNSWSWWCIVTFDDIRLCSYRCFCLAPFISIPFHFSFCTSLCLLAFFFLLPSIATYLHLRQQAQQHHDFSFFFKLVIEPFAYLYLNVGSSIR